MDLFYILQGVIALLAGADLHHVFHIVDEDLAVADMAGVEIGRASCRERVYKLV